MLSYSLRFNTSAGHEGEGGGGNDGQDKERHCLEAHQESTGALIHNIYPLLQGQNPE